MVTIKRSPTSTGTHFPAEEVVDLLETDAEQGLDVFAVKHRREQFGPNAITQRAGPGALERLLSQFRDPLILVLIGAGIVTLVLRDWVDAIVIFGVVFLNALVGYIQEAKAVAAIEALAASMSTEATVVGAADTYDSPPPRSSPATSSCSRPATRSRPTFGSCASASCASMSRRSPASRSRSRRIPPPSSATAGSATASPWPTARRS